MPNTVLVVECARDPYVMAKVMHRLSHSKIDRTRNKIVIILYLVCIVNSGEVFADSHGLPFRQGDHPC